MSALKLTCIRKLIWQNLRHFSSFSMLHCPICKCKLRLLLYKLKYKSKNCLQEKSWRYLELTSEGLCVCGMFCNGVWVQTHVLERCHAVKVKLLSLEFCGCLIRAFGASRAQCGVFGWPTCSPDLRLFETVWCIMGKRRRWQWLVITRNLSLKNLSLIKQHFNIKTILKCYFNIVFFLLFYN